MKFRISLWWLVFLPLMLLSHMGKTLLFLFSMLSLHEGAHILVARYFHYPLSSVTIYPFGLCARIRYIGMGSIWKELLIIIAGPAVHLLFPFVFSLLVQLKLISYAYMEYLCDLNTAILVFNLLPVFPLDGGRVLQSLYHLVFRYTSAQRLTYISAVINLFLLFYYQIITTWSAWLVMGFLLFQILMCWKQIALERLHFYHYRRNHPQKAPLRANRRQDLFRAYTNMIKTEQGWMLEDEWLKRYFHDPPPVMKIHTVL